MSRAALLLCCVLVLPGRAAAQVPSPEAFFGFRMGTDGQLATWEQIEKYFRTVAAASDRVELVTVGPTTEGRTMIAALVSAPENIARLAQIQAANRRLADPRTLLPEEAARIAAGQPAVLAIGASIHATEIGGSQSANELLHVLATTTSPATLALLDQVVLILIPSLNPDGHALVVDWYARQRGTRWDGGPMPWLYHKYAGHDINRDGFMMNLVESRTIAHFFYREWHPQVFLTMHQMGQRGPRFFVPPNHDPIDPNYDPLLWRTAGLLGHAMALALEEDGRSGVVQNALYDYYWPGYEDSAPLGHNTVCLLTEVASVRIASPVTVAPGELHGTSRGLPEYRTQINFPNPWPGGEWRLRDIVEYNLSAVWGLIEAVARYRAEIVTNFYRMGQRAVEAGRRGGPFAFVVPPGQHDPVAAKKLIDLLTDASVEVHRATTAFSVGDETYPAGTQLILMAQPFRAYAKTLLERQDYPPRRTAGGSMPERPYDVVAWTLPYQMGVDVREVDRPFDVPPIVRVDRGSIPPGRVDGDRRAASYVMTAPGVAGSLAINRLRTAGLDVALLLSPWQGGTPAYPRGSLLVRGAPARLGPAVERLAAELGLRATGLRSRAPAPSAVLPLGTPRIGLYKPWQENIDEGWTRWVLERHEFPFATVTDQDVRAGGLHERFDVILLPDVTTGRLINGHAEGTMPQEYTGGIGHEGASSLKAFVQDGGTLITLDSSSQFAISLLDLPLRDVAQDSAAVFCPGSILRMDVDTSNPLGHGMPEQAGAFFTYSSAFELPLPAASDGHGGGTPPADVVPFASYAASNVLMSGWLEGEPRIAGRAAAVETRVGAGRVVLFGFRVQHRGQSIGTFRLLFNAIHTAASPWR